MLQNFANDSDLRAIILTGAGDKAFCAGTDIAELNDLDETDALQSLAARPGAL